MSSNNYSSSLNGGGNSLNLIRIPSLNEVSDIIVSSDLNGSITPNYDYTWQFDKNKLMWSQNDVNETAYVIRRQPNYLISNKTTTITSAYGPTHFCPVIEYKE